jgi:putative CocE/NonD family hydrolase
VQWLAALESPPSLKAMAPAMTYATPETFWFAGGVWDGSWLDWTWLSIAPDLRRRLNRPGPRTDAEAEAAWERESARARRHRPLGTLPDFKGVAPWYYEWMRHPPCDPWWRWAALDGRYGRTRAAVLNLSGWFDEQYGPYGAVTNFARLVAARGGAHPRTAVVLGPWTHGVGAVGASSAGDRSFGAGAALDYADLVLDWMDRYVKGDSASAGAAPRVRVFVMGANQWRTADAWPLPGTRFDTLYLHAPAAGGWGALAPTRPVGADRLSRIRSDPANPVSDPFKGKAGAHDYRSLPAQPGTATFETAPFEQAYDVVGLVAAELTVSASVPDFDLWVQLYDVAPDGTAWNLAVAGSGLIRASYRDCGPKRRLLARGETVQLRLDRTITANRFLPGHRLRVVVSPAFFPLFSVNPQTGEQEFESERVRTGELRIHHAPGGQSALILPAVPVRE